MYVAVAVGSMQGKSRFTVTDGESRNTAVAEGGILLFNKNSVKQHVGYELVKKSSGRAAPCLTNQIFSYIESYLCFCHTNDKPCIFTYSSSFLLMN